MGLGISLLITLPALDGISLFGTELSVWGPTAAGTAGLVGASIIDKILDSDDEDDDGGDDGGEGLMDDEFGGGGGMDDEFGGGMDDDFGGGMDDDFGGEMDGDFGGGGGGGGNIDELEHQLDELENEVASLSSTVNTVKSENTEISDRVEDVEEDIRNLLDIYEMVTRGINPFVDEQDAGDFDMAGGGGGGGLGLFDDGQEESQQQNEDVDDSVMDEDADGFFDDELAEDGEDDEFGEMDDDEFGGEMDDEFEELDAEDDDTDSEEMVSEQDSTGGKSFSELKDEYDSGDASWAEEDEDDSMDDDLGMDDSMDDGLDMDDSMDDSFEDDSMDDGLDMDDSFEDDSMDDDLGMDDSMDDSFDEDGEESSPSHAAPETEQASAPVDDDSGGDFEYVTSDQLSSSGDKPYLTAIPGDYVGDLVVMEWLEFLVEESTVTDAARAVNYYERIDWIDEAAADHLRSFLSGFGNIDRNKVSQPGTDQLNRTHHVHSLKYIMKLNNGTTATSVILDRWDSFAGKGDGL